LREERNSEGTWTVDLASADGVVTVELRETRSAPLLSTCGATRAASVREFALRSITGPGAPGGSAGV
jgi:hypothetical protein